MQLTIKSITPESHQHYYNGRHMDPVMFLQCLLERYLLEHSLESLESCYQLLILEGCEEIGCFCRFDDNIVIVWAKELGVNFNLGDIKTCNQ